MNPTKPLLLDMVHHNPGEAPFATRFTAPTLLAELGYSGQVCKHINACVPFPDPSDGNFPATSEESQWLKGFSSERDNEIMAARRAGLDIYYHVDLFLLPKRVIEARRAEICDEKGSVDITRPATLDLHRRLLAALFARFPDIAGLVIRVGETYLFDTPYHGGNTAVPLHDEAVSREEQMRRFTVLVNFLREEVCVRHGKKLIYRTWDYFGDRFHADPVFYRTVTDAIEPHPLLCFSIKHTSVDFFRGCKPNACLGIGNHPQVVEVQCAREYEGKGAYPNYIARGVIEGFSEVPEPKGVRDWQASPLFAGVWTWSRGGGWFGPYLKHEFWPEFNARILAAWAREPECSEAELFDRICSESYGMDASSRKVFRQICELAEEAVWLGRSIPAFARLRKFVDGDSAGLWMRDDCLGGLDQLRDIFCQLHEEGQLEVALDEKKRAAELFVRIAQLAEELHCSEATVQETILVSARYGARLFTIVTYGWELMARRWKADNHLDVSPVTSEEIAHYRELWADYHALPKSSEWCATLYRPHYWNWPGQPLAPGMDASVLEVI